MKPLFLLLLLSAATAQAQTTVLQAYGNVMKQREAKLKPTLLRQRLAANSPEKMLQAGTTYRSQPNTMRILVPDTVRTPMPTTSLENQLDPNGVFNLPPQQYVPDRPGRTLGTNPKQQAAPSKAKP
jgi:hypothetical protein